MADESGPAELRQPVDPETLALVLDSVRRLVDQELIPAEARADAEQAVPPELIQRMRELGLFGLNVPIAYGGLGFGMREEVQILFELCRASPSFRGILGTTVGVGGKSIALDGSPAQRRKWLPRIARGETIVSFCLTEADSGSDARAMKTRAVRSDSGWRLNGSKRFISNADIAELFVVMARTDDHAGAVSAFLVEAGTPGLEIGPHWNKMGQRGAPVCDVHFNDCRLPADALLGDREGVGFRTAMKALDDGRVHMAAVAVGLSRRLLEESIGYARQRRQFGRTIGEFQLIQGMLADSEAELAAAQALVERTAARRDAGETVTRDAASCKYFATEALSRIADRAVQIHGGYGYMRDTAVERLFRDSRLFRIYEGTSQIMQVVIARELMRAAN